MKYPSDSLLLGLLRGIIAPIIARIVRNRVTTINETMTPRPVPTPGSKIFSLSIVSIGKYITPKEISTKLIQIRAV